MTEDPTRRTRLAAERTWLAWWRSGLAATAVSVAVGGIAPQLAGGSRGPYVALGAGYALLAIAVFVGASRRRREVERALATERYAPLNETWAVALTAAGVALAVATLVVTIVEP